MAKKEIRVAVWEYRDKAKKRRLGYYGQVVDLPAAEVKRGEAAGVFGDFDAVADEQESTKTPATVPADADPAATLPQAPVDAGDDDLAGLGDGEGDTTTPAADPAGDTSSAEDTPSAGDVPAGDTVPRPKNTAPQAEWVEYAVAKGLDRAEAEALERADLIKALS